MDIMEFVQKHEDIIHWAFETPFPIVPKNFSDEAIELSELARKELGYSKYLHVYNILEYLKEAYIEYKLKDVEKRYSRARGERAGSAKLTNTDIIYIRCLYKTNGYTHRELAEMFGVTYRVIGKIINRKIWTHIP